MAKVGASVWNQLDFDEQASLVMREVWKEEKYLEWVAEKEDEAAKKRPGAYKQYQRYKKHNSLQS